MDQPYVPGSGWEIPKEELQLRAVLHRGEALGEVPFLAGRQPIEEHPWCRPPPDRGACAWVAPAERRRQVLAAKAAVWASSHREWQPNPSLKKWPEEEQGGAGGRYRILWKAQQRKPRVESAASGRKRPPDALEEQQRGSSAVHEAALQRVGITERDRLQKKFRSFRVAKAGDEPEWVVQGGAVLAQPPEAKPEEEREQAPQTGAKKVEPAVAPRRPRLTWTSMGVGEFRGTAKAGVAIAYEAVTDMVVFGEADALDLVREEHSDPDAQWSCGTIQAVLGREYPPRISVDNGDASQALNFVPARFFWTVRRRLPRVCATAGTGASGGDRCLSAHEEEKAVVLADDAPT